MLQVFHSQKTKRVHCTVKPKGYIPTPFSIYGLGYSITRQPDVHSFVNIEVASIKKKFWDFIIRNIILYTQEACGTNAVHLLDGTSCFMSVSCPFATGYCDSVTKCHLKWIDISIKVFCSTSDICKHKYFFEKKVFCILLSNDKSKYNIPDVIWSHIWF